MHLHDLVDIFGGELHRDGDFESLGKASHDKAKMLTFLESEEFLPVVRRNNRITCVLTTRLLAQRLPKHLGIAFADSPRLAFYLVHDFLRTHTEFYWRSFPTEIAATSNIHPSAYVAPRDVRIGSGSVVEPHAMIMERTEIGENSIARAGCVIGGDGFEFRRIGATVRGVADTGGVKIGNRVEIHHNTVVQRAPYGGFTTVADDTKIGGSANIGHHCQIGRRCFISAGVTLCGNCTIGDDVWLGPGSVISNGLTIGDRSFVTIGAVVTRSVRPGQKVSGNFAVDHERFLRFTGSVMTNPQFAPTRSPK